MGSQYNTFPPHPKDKTRLIIITIIIMYGIYTALNLVKQQIKAIQCNKILYCDNTIQYHNIIAMQHSMNIIKVYVLLFLLVFCSVGSVYSFPFRNVDPAKSREKVIS